MARQGAQALQIQNRRAPKKHQGKPQTKSSHANNRGIGVFKPKERCHCNLPTNLLCSKAPDLNGVENVWNKVEMDLKDLGKKEGWPKNLEELIQRLKQILDEIPNSYFKKLYDSYPKRWKKCVKLGGK